MFLFTLLDPYNGWIYMDEIIMWPVTKIARCHVSAIHRPRLIVYKYMSTEVLYFTIRHQEQQRAKPENVLMSETWIRMMLHCQESGLLIQESSDCAVLTIQDLPRLSWILNSTSTLLFFSEKWETTARVEACVWLPLPN